MDELDMEILRLKGTLFDIIRKQVEYHSANKQLEQERVALTQKLNELENKKENENKKKQEEK